MAKENDSVLVRNVTKRTFNGIGSYQITNVPKEHLDRYIQAWFEEYTGQESEEIIDPDAGKSNSDIDARKAFLVEKWVTNAIKYGDARVIKESNDLWYGTATTVVDPATLSDLGNADKIITDGSDEDEDEDEEIIDEGADATTGADADTTADATNTAHDATA